MLVAVYPLAARRMNWQICLCGNVAKRSVLGKLALQFRVAGYPITVV